MEFTNNVAGSDSAMQVDHLARECPSKGKGKGIEKGTDKGKGKGMSSNGTIRNNAKGKGKSKGPMFGTCWTCGGAHYAANCPKGKGKGLNQVGERGGLRPVEA